MRLTGLAHAWMVAVMFAGALPVITGAQAPASKPATLAITGDVPKPLTLGPGDLRTMPRTTVTVTQTDGTKAVYEGVAVTEMLTRSGVPLNKGMPGNAIASYIVARGADGYQAVLAYAEVDPALSSSGIIVADRLNGAPLADGLGPFRLIVGHDKLASRHVRMLERLEMVQLRK